MRLIDADVARDVGKYIPWCEDWLVREAVDAIPTEDAKPVVIAHWVAFLDGEDDGIFCSKCKENLLDAFPYASQDRLPKFCPNCGAKMDEEGGDDNEYV